MTPNGNAAHCVVLKAIAFISLNSLACRSILNFALFLAAIDAQGRPVTAHTHTRIHLELPTD